AVGSCDLGGSGHLPGVGDDVEAPFDEGLHDARADALRSSGHDGCLLLAAHDCYLENGRTWFGLFYVRDAGVVRGSRTGSRPEGLAVTCGDGAVIDAGFPPTHQAVVVEFPELVAVAAEPLAGVVVPFVLEAHRDAALVEGPKRLHQPVVKFPLPFPSEELL